MSLYARGKYGDNDFDYPFFKEKPDIHSFPSLLLRNSGNDQDQTLLRDAFLQALVKQSMDIDFQSHQPVTVYLNGTYMGIYNLREKTNEDYVVTNYYIEEGDFDMLERDLVDITGRTAYPPVWLNGRTNHLNIRGLEGGLYFVRIFRDGVLVHTGRLVLVK